MERMNARTREALTGAVILAAGFVFLAVTYSSSGRKVAAGYDVTATFNKTDGLAENAAVRMSGLVVGKVSGYRLDENYRAVVTMHVRPGLAVPLDSAALIHTDGLLGAKYIELQPGGEDKLVKPGGAMLYTQDSVDIVDLLEKIVDQAKSKRAKAQAEAQADAQTAGQGGGEVK
jgi:phospholipid/cholesterol/gamma-HCH transport system substrate-binding protein